MLCMALAAVVAAAALRQVMREPAPGAPAPAAPATEPAVAALPPTLPDASPASAASATSRMAPGPARPAATAAPVTAAPRIGAEGYGPHIERAQAGGDAAAAWEAVQWLQQCASNEARRQSYERVRGERFPQEMLTQLMLEADAEGRLCQTVTAHHRAMQQELTLRAMRGGVPQAAIGFAMLVSPGGISAALRHEVADALRREADAGQLGSLLGAAAHGAAWGLGDDERLAYLVAYGEMHSQGGQTMVKEWIARRIIPFKTPPTPEQLSAAQTAGRRIVDRMPTGTPP
jgi:hypothetical protein